MATFDELFELVSKASLSNSDDVVDTVNESVKGSIGRSALNTIDKAKNFVDKSKEKSKSFSDSVKSGYDKAKSNKVSGPIVKGAEKVGKAAAGAVTYPISKSADVAANAIVKSKENKIRKEFSGNPEKMENELKKNVDRLDGLKSDIMALEVWTIGWPAAIATLGVLDNVLKAIIGIGAMARNDKALVGAVAKATVWAPVAAAKISKIMGKEITGDKALSIIKETTNKILNTLKGWANSDKGILKENIAVSEHVDDELELAFIICESIVNEQITYDDASYLIESMYDIWSEGT